MPKRASIDCIIVGYHDIDFQWYVNSQQKMAEFNGGYRDAKHNSVLLNGRRLNFNQLLNWSIRKGTGHDPNLNIFEVPSLATTYLTSFLRRRGFNAQMVGFFNKEKEKFADLLADSPAAVAITTTYYIDFYPIVDIVEFVRERSPGTKIIVGGPHIYNVCDQGGTERGQNHIFKSVGADVYVYDSQGEQTLANILQALRDRGPSGLDQVPNLTYTLDQETFERTKRVVESNDLDDNVVDYSLFTEEDNVFSFPVFMRTARSCPFSCAFCNFPTLAGKHQVSAIDVVERQLQDLHEKGVRSLIFIDDTFNVPLPRFKNLLRMMIRNRFDFEWISFFRCSNADETAFDLMQESGCKQVFLGIESGDQQILNNMNKFADVARYRRGIRALEERGIVTYASLITGFPGETRETVMNTIEFIEDARPSFYNFTLFYHDPRTPIEDHADKFQLHGSGFGWRHGTMDWQEAADWVEYGFANVKNSLPAVPYAFSIWALPYLLSQDLTLEEFKQFLSIGREMLVESFDDAQVDFRDQERRLVELFKSSRIAAAEAPLPAAAGYRLEEAHGGLA